MKEGLKKDIAIVMLSVLLSLLIFYAFNINNSSVTQTQTVNVNTETTKEIEKININSCSKEALMELPGIHKTLANRIISYRPYNDIYQLKSVPGIATEKFNAVKNLIKVGD